jgi:hypothetical protein
MSDDKPKRDDASSTSIPPELKPFMGQREWPKAERRDEAEVQAAFAPVEAMLAEWQREADKRDAERGVGNVSEYVAPLPVPEAGKPAAPSPDAKVAIGFVDVLRQLPAGNPNLPTEEISTRGLRGVRADADDDDDATLARGAAQNAKSGGVAAASTTEARPARTIGGNTEKMPVIAALPVAGTPGSPWAEVSGTAAVTSSALPSSHGPQATVAHEDDAPGSVAPARSSGDGRGRMTGLVIAGALVLVAAAFGVRAVTTTTPDGAGTRVAATSAPTAPPPPSAVEPLATSVAMPSVEPPAPAATPTPTATAQMPARSVATAHPIAPAPKGRSGPADDPYDAVPAPIPAPTAAPSVAPVAPPPPASTKSLTEGKPVY